MLDKDIARLNIKADGYCLISAACLITLNLKMGHKVKLYTAYAPALAGWTVYNISWDLTLINSLSGCYTKLSLNNNNVLGPTRNPLSPKLESSGYSNLYVLIY